jgi:hypothetical protein
MLTKTMIAMKSRRDMTDIGLHMYPPARTSNFLEDTPSPCLLDDGQESASNQARSAKIAKLI